MGSKPFEGMIEIYGAAIRNGRPDDIKRMLSPDVVSYDATPPLENTGKTVASERLDSWMGAYASAMGCEIRFGSSAESGDVGFCWFLERITGTRKDGVDIDMWVRVTWCLRRIDAEWLIVHEHQSDPFEAKTLKARIDLEPKS